MATCQTSRWVSTAPYIKLTVTIDSQTATAATLAWTLQYIADSAANTNTARSYAVKINGSTVKSGTYSIDGKSGTNTIASGTVSVTKGTSAKSIAFSCSMAFNLTWSGEYAGTKSASGSISVGAKTKYTVSYSANGGSGAPSAQTKWHGTTLTLSSAKPTRTGHSFVRWVSSGRTDGTVYFQPGETTDYNGNQSLVAEWKANTYTVSYNANGGSGAPGSQTKTYGKTLTLSSTKPTRANYTFKGWATSASGGVAYKAGGSYTANAKATLYAVWELAYTKPKITNFSVSRSGTSAVVKFNWSSYVAAPTVSIDWKTASDSNYGTAETYTTTGTSGTFSKTLAYTSFSQNATYTIRVTVNDGTDETFAVRSLPSAAYIVDFLRTKTGVAIGKIAELANTFDVGWLARFRKDVTVGEKTGHGDGRTGVFLDADGYMHLQRSSAEGYHPYIGFYIDDSTEISAQIRYNPQTDFLEFTSAGGYSFGHNVILPNECSVRGKSSDGTILSMLGMSANNCIVGWGVHNSNIGNTHVYGKDIVVYPRSTGTNYRPYYRAGDSMTLSIHTSGFVTNSGTEVRFIVPLAKPIVGSPNISMASGDGFILRQGSKYTHGSAASTYVKPSSYTKVGDTDGNSIIVQATFSNTTNVTNNDVIAIYWNGTITLS